MKRIIALVSIAIFILGISACKKKDVVIINNATDLEGKRIGCQAGTTGELYIQESIKNAKIKSFKTGIDASLDLKNGAIDAIVLD
ncbi:MAG: transporter substrate-binding domain-containing protein, partial [Spirochaetales bacterium]|nr:transporter substrate-binding domain-containing protein [Spirochaetales bacterium]